MRLGRIYYSSFGCLSTCQTALAVTSSLDAERTQRRFEKLQLQCHIHTITFIDVVYQALRFKIRNLNLYHRGCIESTSTWSSLTRPAFTILKASLLQSSTSQLSWTLHAWCWMNSSSISEVICMCSRVEGEQGGWDMYLPDPQSCLIALCY